MNNIEFSFEISKQVFIDLYRTHVRYKFRLHRSMIMSVCLLVFGLVMEYGFKMDFNFINTVVFWITIASITVNLLSDYVLPKTAFNNLMINHGEKGKIQVKDEGFNIILSNRTEKKLWEDYDSCIETDTAFLLYKKDIYSIIMKEDIYTEQMREVFKTYINKGKIIQIKR